MRRQISIGGLPSGIEEDTLLSSLCISDVSALWFACIKKNYATLIPILDSLTDRDVSKMYMGDLIYLATWLRKISSTEVSKYVTWRCGGHAPFKGKKMQNHKIDEYASMTPSQLSARGIKMLPCSRSSTSSIENHKLSIKPKVHLTAPLTYPKVFRYEEDEIEDYPFMELLYWIDADTHFEAKHILEEGGTELFDRIHKAKAEPFGLHETFTARCQWCYTPLRVSKFQDIFNVLKIIDPSSCMNMQYNLGSTNLNVTESTPLLNLIFWHSQYQKDKNEAEEQRRLRAAMKR